MNSEEIKSLIEQLKAQGLTEDEIMNVFYETFVKGDMDRKDLETLAEAMGYELTDDFKNEPTPDPIASKGAEGLSEEALEDAKAIEPGESVEEFKEGIEEAKEGLDSEEAIESEEEAEEDSEEEPKDEEEEKESEEVEEEDEDAEWEKAQKMFKI